MMLPILSCRFFWWCEGDELARASGPANRGVSSGRRDGRGPVEREVAGVLRAVSPGPQRVCGCVVRAQIQIQ